RWADYSAKRQRPVLRRPLYLSARWKSRKYRRPVIQRIAFELLFSCPQNAQVEAISAAEKVIDADQIPWPPDFVRRVPQVTRGIESITIRISIRRRVALEKLQYPRMAADFQRIVGIHIVASDTIRVRGRRAVAHPISQGAGGFHEQRRVGRNLLAI